MASIASLLLLLVMGSILLAAIPSMAAARGMKLGTRQNSKGSDEEEGFIAMPTEKASSQFGTRWAILLAGSSGYGNYRHQADVCHAYQVLKRGGLNDENIIVFMADDIAQHPANPHPGIIINNPLGSDVYAGVPKDYTGQNVTVDNFYAALLGNKSALTGGSGKVVDSGPDDHIFIFYSDHGGPGVLGMPTNPNLYANDFIEVLKQKYAANAYKEMVIYVEACESGSIFEGLLPDNINIYVTTASNAIESSWGTYCPGMHPAPPLEYYTCLGDLYSVSWMEDSEMHNLERETIRDQYNTVKTRTSNGNTYTSGSHVMQYGELKISIEALETYMGSDPVNQNLTRQLNGFFPLYGWDKIMAVNQRDADLLYLWFKYKMADEGTKEKSEALEEMIEVMSHRSHLDRSVKRIGHLLFSEQGSLLSQARPHGQPLADDWDCLKSMVRVFESQCGSLGQYGLKHMRAFANICNAKVSLDKMVEASSEACSKRDLVGPWNPHQVGFSA